jgi:hypothetical protein
MDTYKNTMRITKIKKGFSKKEEPWELLELVDEGEEMIYDRTLREKVSKKIKKCTLSVFTPMQLQDCFEEGDLVEVSGELRIQNFKDEAGNWSKKIELKFPKIERLNDQAGSEVPF